MKTGKSIVELATEIERQISAKNDYIADTREMHVTDDMRMLIGDIHNYGINDHAHRQLGQKLGVPAIYYDKLRTNAPDLLADNLNYWLERPEKNHERRMVRTLDGNMRAFLSDRYRRIDNDIIAQAILPILLGTDGMSVRSAEITDRRMYLQVVFPRIEAEVKKGDVVQAGVLVSNSEIGSGGFTVSPLVFRLECLNGMVSSHSLKRQHVGRKVESEEGAYEIYSDATLQADDKALMLKMQDVVKASMNEASFMQQVTQLRDACNGQQIINPIKAIETLSKKVGLTGDESNNVLTNLIKDGDLSKYGLIQAVTAVANNHDSYDRAIEFEQLGSKVLDLSRSEWSVIADAA